MRSFVQGELNGLFIFRSYESDFIQLSKGKIGLNKKYYSLIIAIIKSKSYFCNTIWHRMTEDSKRLLVLFEVRFRELIARCDQQKLKIKELESALEQKNTELNNAISQIEALNAKCDNMLTAQVLSVREGDLKNAKMRLSKLVREVDKCITLLNE